jgi:YD repeat-containing protein
VHLGGVSADYVIDDADKLTEVKSGGTPVKTYGYDAAGRTTSVVSGAGTTTIAYDYEDRISQITYPSTATNTFAYNGLDTRVSKVDSAGTSTFLRDGAYVTDPVPYHPNAPWLHTAPHWHIKDPKGNHLGDIVYFEGDRYLGVCISRHNKRRSNLWMTTLSQPCR